MSKKRQVSEDFDLDMDGDGDAPAGPVGTEAVRNLEQEFLRQENPPECLPCTNDTGATVRMVAYSTKRLFTYYRCPACGRTDKVVREERAARYRARMERKAKAIPGDPRLDLGAR